jgi:hypothetical protein
VTFRFEFFAIVAGMRTGSNLLEELLAGHPQITCHGELFNPHFVGVPGKSEALGISREARDQDPIRLLDAVRRAHSGIAGFRVFDGHDDRALEMVLRDVRCAKIILSRNPLDSYLSLKIARSTGQWWLGNLASAKTEKVRFDPAEFGEFLGGVGSFRHRVRRVLQETGQAAYHIDYDDLRAPEVIGGLFAFLGCDAAPVPSRTRSKAQNPRPAVEKVTNPTTLRTALSRIDPFDADRGPDFEAVRGAGVPRYRVAADAPVLFTPVGSVACAEVDGWLTNLSDGRPPKSGLSQRELRAWMRDRPGHRRLAVVEHPASRIHEVFSKAILPPDRPEFGEVRDILVRHHAVPLPDDPRDPGYDGKAHREAFLGFLRFVRGNLGGQTGLRPHPAWSSQSVVLAGICRFAIPDVVMRKETLATELGRISKDLGLRKASPGKPDPGFAPVALVDMMDGDIAEAVRAAYRRDFVQFGYRSV